MKKKIRKIKKSKTIKNCSDCEFVDEVFEGLFGEVYTQMKEKYANCAECKLYKESKKMLDDIQKEFGQK